MAKKTQAAKTEDFIESLNMNGLEGRMMHLPPQNNKRHILFVYGHHSKLEWWFEFAKLLNRYGSVTVPDMPGFGGMESLRKIHERSTLNNWADYLAAFIKLRYKKGSQITIVGTGFGFVAVTRMLQRYPNIAKRVDFVVAIDGIAHADDLKISPSKRRKLGIKNSFKLALPFSRQLFYGKNSLSNMLRKARTKNNYLLENLLFFCATPEEEADFWKVNDLGAHVLAIRSMLKLDNCIKKIDTNLWQVPANNAFIDYHNAEQHLKIAYKDLNIVKPRSFKKSSTKDLKFGDLLPAKLRKELSKQPK